MDPDTPGARPTATERASAPRGRRSLLALALAAGALPACDPARGLLPLPPTASGPYRLAAGDEVRVTVFEEARLSGTFRVGDAGALSIPLLGPVPAAGLTVSGLREEIDREIKRRGFLDEPRTAVEVAAYRSVFVLGEVERGGAFAWQPGLTALAAVALAGGFSPRAVRDRLMVQRAIEGEARREYLAGRDAVLEPGDVLTVLERRF